MMMNSLSLGSIHKGRLQNFWIFGPPPPLVRNLDRSIRLNPRNLPYYVCFWTNPPSPLCADVLYVWSLRRWIHTYPKVNRYPSLCFLVVLSHPKYNKASSASEVRESPACLCVWVEREVGGRGGQRLRRREGRRGRERRHPRDLGRRRRRRRI